MIVNRDRERLLNTIIYFVRNTKHCHTLKLFKLLNFLDFEHFRQTGRTVTGLNYVAWPQGPAPSDLWREIQRGGDRDLRAIVSLVPIKDDATDQMLRRDIKPKAEFDKRLFSKRELTILERLAEIFDEARGETMTEFSHIRGLPWNSVYRGGKGKGDPIDPELSLVSDPIIQEMENIHSEELAFRKELLAGLR